jgi:hypothetical protein
VLAVIFVAVVAFIGGIATQRFHSTVLTWLCAPSVAPRSHSGALINWTDDEHVVLADLGYEGENTRLICPIKNTRGVTLTVEHRHHQRAALRHAAAG